MKIYTEVMLILINKIFKKRRLKKKIYNEFVKACSDKNWKKIDILGKRYLSL
jgi:hypothetical protein